MPEQSPAEGKTKAAASRFPSSIELYFNRATLDATDWLSEFNKHIVASVRVPIALTICVAVSVVSIAIAMPYLHHTEMPTWFPVVFIASALAGLGLGTLAGRAAVRSFAALRERLLCHIHSNLVDGGLLRAALEHSPFDRLPTLAPWRPWPLRTKVQANLERDHSMAARLRQLARSYASCARHMGLTAYLPPIDRLAALARTLLWLPVIPLAVAPFVVGRSLSIYEWNLAFLPTVLVSVFSIASLASLHSLTTHLTSLALSDLLHPGQAELADRPTAAAIPARELTASRGRTSESPLRDNQADA